MKPSHRTGLFALLALVPAAAAVSGCQRGVRDVPVLGALGRPAITAKNETSVAVNMTVWTTNRSAKSYADSWLAMRGRTERIMPGGSAVFYIDEVEQKSDPIVRVEIKTRGPSFQEDVTQWFEAVGKPPFNAKLTGQPGDIRFDNQSHLLVRIPDSQVMARDRRLVNQQDRFPVGDR